MKRLFAQQDWQYPIYAINCDAPDTQKAGCYGQPKPEMYQALPVSKISKKWNVCVSFPTLKDPYWVAVNAGLAKEAKRDNVKMTILSAGSYNNLSTQVNQLQNCVANGAEAIIVGAISYSGLDAQLQSYVKKGIVVIDAWNGLSLPDVSSHALIDYFISGGEAAKYLMKVAKQAGRPLNVAVLPGPAGAGWSERTAAGFKKALEGQSDVKVVGVKYGDTGQDTQLELAQNVLQTYKDVDWIFANAPGATQAAVAIKQANKASKVRVIASYTTPAVYEGVKSGDIACVANDQTVGYSRIAMDLAVRKLEKQPAFGDLQRIWALPRPIVICGDSAGKGQNNLDQFVYDASLFPPGFKPTLNVG
ncbi:MAG TPA: TMAO reductase system periplasmic protein TorT [Solirubrobacteraceae bacterium]